MKRAIAALACLLVSVPLIGGPSPASAQARRQGQITVNWAGSVNEDLGKIHTSITSTAPIATIKAHILSAAGAELARTTDFALTSGSTTDGIWTTRGRVRVAELGSYRIDIEVTATDGTHVTAAQAGQFVYMVRTVFDPLTSSPATVDQSHRTITVSGRAFGIWPGTGERKPLGRGFPIGLSISYLDKNGGFSGFDRAELTTDAHGRFRHRLTLLASAEFTAAFVYDNVHFGYISGNSEALVIRPVEAATEIQVTVTPARVDFGHEVTVSGLARRRSPAGWRPLANTELGVVTSNFDTLPAVTTDANGRYSFTFVPWDTGTITVAFYTEDSYTANAITTVPFTVAHPAAFADFAAERQGGDIVASGHLVFPGHVSPGSPEVIIEFSADGTTWTTRATSRAEWHGEGYAFSGAFAEPAAGQVRARFEGGETFQDAQSQAVSVS
ncbi:hypothetical protein J5X84_08510 [Streptosporangiaceae bacterium NEAU-GS5]|nr:hypothetical protein [Streptosporangiaceae bacterium NEAU-GS5]